MVPVLELLRQSGRMYRKHAGLFAGYAAWLLLPYAALVLLHLTGDPTGGFLATLFLVVQAFLLVWMMLLFPLIAYEIACGKKRLSPDALQQKLQRLLPSAMFVALIETAVVLGGFILLIIPGLIFTIWFMFATLSVLFDETRGMRALAFSRELVRGRFWRVAWLGICGPFVIFLCYLFVVNLLVTVFATAGQMSLETITTNPPPLWIDIVAQLGEVFTLPWLAIYATLLYMHVRETKPELAPATPHV